MYKHLAFVTLLFFSCISFSYAQKIDLDKKPFTIEYIELPKMSTLTKYNTYSADMYANQATLNQLGLLPGTINTYFDLDGYKYTKESGEFTYSIQMDKLQVLQEGVSESLETIKKSDGTSQTVSQYTALCVIVVPTTITIQTASGELIYESQFATNTKPIAYKSALQSSQASAQTLVNTKQNGINTYAKDLYLKTLKDEITKLKRNFCFSKTTFQTHLLYIDEKNNPSQAPFNIEVNNAYNILTEIKYNKPLTEAQEKMATSLDYWSTKANSIQGTDKILKKEKYANLYNLALCQYYLEQFDACEITCQLLILNEFNKNDGTEILNAINTERTSITNSGAGSRHLNRIGFMSQERYVYTPSEVPTVKKLNFIEQNKQDFKDLSNSVTAIGKDIHDDFANPKITDTLFTNETFFSSIKYEQNGEVIEHKGNELSAGYCMPNQRSPACDPETYSVTITKKIGVIPPKVGTLIRCDLNFQTNYKRSPKFNADSLIALIKKYEQDKLVDITNCSKDSIPFVINGEYIQGTRLFGKDYNKKLSADLTFLYYTSGTDGGIFYKTNIGDAFNVKIVNIVPVIVREEYVYHKITPKAYVVTMQIPEVRLTKLLIGHIWLYKQEYITIKNIEIKVLLFSTEPQ